jgi:hypothetical protein
MFVNEKPLLVRYQPEQRAFIPICRTSDGTSHSLFDAPSIEEFPPVAIS